MNDFQITDYTGRSGELQSIMEERSWIENIVKDSKSKNFNIVELNNDELIGSVGLAHINWINRSAVLGVFIGDEKYRNNGYGTEAINLLLEYSFRYINLHSIRLELLDINERAHKCYLKCGFKDMGRSREKRPGRRPAY